VFKPLLDKPGLKPIVEKTCGAKEIKMIYAGTEGGETKNVPTSKAERGAYVLSDEEILNLARQAATIEKHYGQPMDMEWAKDGETGKLYIVQARPETVQSRIDVTALKSYTIKKTGKTLLTGLSVGAAVRAGRVCLIENVKDIDKFVDGSILVTSTTDPDWVPIMKRATAIVTDHGGRTSHAAIVSRELGLPAIVGTGNATHVLHDQQEVTISCAGGEEGAVYEGIAEYDRPMFISTTCRRPRPASCLTLPILRPPSAGGGCPPTASVWRGWSSSSIPPSRCTRWRWSISTRSRTRKPRPRSPN
jgi:pyruvate,water dikinase